MTCWHDNLQESRPHPSSWPFFLAVPASPSSSWLLHKLHHTWCGPGPESNGCRAFRCRTPNCQSWIPLHACKCFRRSAARKCHLDKRREGIGDKMKLRQFWKHGANKTWSLQNFFQFYRFVQRAQVISSHFPPGIASKIASSGARESAQPMMAV